MKNIINMAALRTSYVGKTVTPFNVAFLCDNRWSERWKFVIVSVKNNLVTTRNICLSSQLMATTRDVRDIRDASPNYPQFLLE
jgi:hypothetical protein